MLMYHSGGKNMHWLAIFVFTFSSIGLTHIVVEGMVLTDWRKRVKDSHKKVPFSNKEWGDMLDCHQCTGFWCGMACAILLIPFVEIEWTFLRLLFSVPLIVLLGFAASYLSVAGRALIDWLTFSVNIPLEDFDEETVSTGD